MILECVHRGNRIGLRTCEHCGNKGVAVITYTCNLYGECTLVRYQVGQGEMVCEECPDQTPTLQFPVDREG